MAGTAALRSLVACTFREWWNDNTFRLAAALAFYTVFSIAPVLVISVSISAFVFDEAAARREIVAQIEQLVGTEGASAVEDVLRSAGAVQESPLPALIGILMLIVGSTAVFAELQSALNTIWDVEVDVRPRSAWRSLLSVRLRSFVIVLGVGFLLMVSLVINALISGLQGYLEGRMPEAAWVWQAVNSVVSFGVLTVLFAMIYRYLPDVKLTWSDVAIGGAVTSALFTLGKYLIGLYLGHVAVGSAYGAAGSFAVLLIWVYYSALISFFGAEFTQVWVRQRRARVRPELHAVKVGRKPEDLAPA